MKSMAEPFGVKLPAICEHMKHIFGSGELAEEAAVSILETTAADGKKYQTQFYNLDAVIAVGYRVNSLKATHFRIWATNTLREYIVKGFVLDDQMLKNGRSFGKDYFDELLEMSKLNRLAGMFIDFAELRAIDQKVLTMKDWLAQVGKFLTLTDQQILKHAGKISHEIAMAKAHQEYDKFRPKQDQAYISDFDQKLAKYLQGEKPQ